MDAKIQSENAEANWILLYQCMQQTAETNTTNKEYMGRKKNDNTWQIIQQRNKDEDSIKPPTLIEYTQT